MLRFIDSGDGQLVTAIILIRRPALDLSGFFRYIARWPKRGKCSKGALIELAVEVIDGICLHLGDLLTADELAALLKVHVTWVYARTRCRSRERMPHLKIGSICASIRQQLRSGCRTSMVRNLVRAAAETYTVVTTQYRLDGSRKVC